MRQERYKVLGADQKEKLHKTYLEKVGVDPFAPPK